MKKIILLSLFPILLTGCTKNKINTSEINHFKYVYGSGLGTYYSYDITYIDNKLILKKSNIHEVDRQIEIDKNVLDNINRIINENEIYKWNGFDKVDKNVLDGNSFSLVVNYSDGKSITAHGYMKYPSGYKEKIKPLQDYLSSIN